MFIRSKVLLVLLTLSVPVFADNTLEPYDFRDGLEYKVMNIEVTVDTPSMFCIKVDDNPVDYCYPQETSND